MPKDFLGHEHGGEVLYKGSRLGLHVSASVPQDDDEDILGAESGEGEWFGWRLDNDESVGVRLMLL
jgi:hypothetical protein